MIALGNRPGLICKGKQPVDVYVGGHPVTPGITLEDYPSQETSGSVVTCEPITGYKLGVTSHITAVQEGTGDPTPDNVRPIVGWDIVTLTHNSQTHTRALPETVYGGTLDWRTGLLTVDRAKYVVTGNEHWQKNDQSKRWQASVRVEHASAGTSSTGNTDVICTHAITALHVNYIGVWVVPEYNGYLGLRWKVEADKNFADADALKVYLAEQYAAGTPMEYVSKIATPYTIQLTPQQLVALAGTNTIYSNSGDTTVTYRIRKT